MYSLREASYLLWTLHFRGVTLIERVLVSLVISTPFIATQFIGTTSTDLKGLFVGSSSAEPVQAEKNDHANAGGLLFVIMVPNSVPVSVRASMYSKARVLRVKFSDLGFQG